MLGPLRLSSLSPIRSSLLSPLSSSPAAAFSTSNSPPDVLLDILKAASAEKPFKGPSSKNGVAVNGWKPFRSHSVVRPHELTYQARNNDSRTFRRRPAAVGPPPSEARYNDPFYQLNLDPLSFATNAIVLSNFVSEMGKIYGRPVTGLTTKSQRKLGKAIRRAKMMGIIPNLSKPPNTWMYNKRKPAISL